MTTANNTTANEVKLTPTEKRALTIKTLSAKGRDELTGYEIQRLASALWKQEEKSLRYVYNELKRAYNSEKPSSIEALVIQLTGKAFPTWGAFSKAYTMKHFSRWGGLNVLRNMNHNYQRAQRVARQNKATAQK
jgi:phosphopantetheinyl transferase (holo-ACP synthase)